MPLLTNDLWLHTDPLPLKRSHFKLTEFANPDGLAMLHPSALFALERVRADLCLMFSVDVSLLLTNTIRTPYDNHRLARVLGWTDNGGAVSRHSRHLTKFGGIAVDFYAIHSPTTSAIPQDVVARVARRHFDFVKADYPDGHVHADQRTRAATAEDRFP